MASTYQSIDAIRGRGIRPIELPDPPATDQRPESVQTNSSSRGRAALLAALTFQSSADVFSASFNEPTFNRYGIPTLTGSFYSSLTQAGLNNFSLPTSFGQMTNDDLQSLLNPSPFGSSFFDFYA